MRRAAPARLLRAVVLTALAVATWGTHAPLQYDAPLPAVVRICVMVYPPFVLERAWYGRSFESISYPPTFNDPSSLSGIVFRGVNTSLLDGFDVAFTKLLFNEFLGSAVEFYPYPDTSSLYIGLRNDECDVAAAAVEYEPGRATCSASCPDPAVTPLPDLPGADYVQESYRERLDTICCLEYGVPHLPANGFALFSKVIPKDVSLVTAILSVDVLNAATPIVIAVVAFGWLMYLVERRDNNSQFHAQHSGVYFASVSLATFGYGDVAPVTRMGRVLTIFWCVMSVMSISALTSVISARLTIDQLAYTTIDSLSQLRPSDLCVEKAYPAVEGFVSDEYALRGDLVGAGVTLGTPQECAAAVMSGKVLAYLTDRPLLLWLAYEYLSTGGLYVSQTIRANPLTLAYPSGSTLRPLADAAVIRMTTNTAWSTARQRLESAWFPQGTTSSQGQAQQVNVPTLVAACVLVLCWLLGMLVSVGRKALRATKAEHALSRVSTVLRSRFMGRKAGDDDAEAAAGNGDAAAAQADGQQTAEWTKAGGTSPHIETLLP